MIILVVAYRRLVGGFMYEREREKRVMIQLLDLVKKKVKRAECQRP